MFHIYHCQLCIYSFFAFVCVPVLHGFFCVCVGGGVGRRNCFFDRVLLSGSFWNLLCRPNLPLSCSNSLLSGVVELRFIGVSHHTQLVMLFVPSHLFLLFACGGNVEVRGQFVDISCLSTVWVPGLNSDH